jgi:hypothetical protein
VDTTATVWLGLTMGCARCHDHKFDPITQKEFYQVFAYFNNVPERGKAVKYGNSPPMIKAPTPRQREQLRALERQLAAAESCFNALKSERTISQGRWEKSLDTTESLPWTITQGLIAHYELDGDTRDRRVPARRGTFEDGDAAFIGAHLRQAANFDGQRFINAGEVAKFGYYDKFSLAAWIQLSGPRGGTIISRMVDVPQGEGYSLGLEGGKIQVNLVKRWLDDALRVETERSLVPGRWYHVVATYDGSRVASGLRVYVDGRPEKLKVHLDDLNQSFQSSQPLRIGAGGGRPGRFHGAIADVRIYHDCLTPAQAEIIATPQTINDIAAIPREQRTEAQSHKIEAYYLENESPPRIRAAWREVVQLRTKKHKLIESLPTTMVMEELPSPRPAFVLTRGQYDKPGPRVRPGVPASLPPLPKGAEPNRLGFAKWLVDPRNPLTARVAVNRWWELYFGTGLVKTTEDFGSQGEWPSHPELLDWLATELIRTRWDVKAMQRLIVTSATYRQSARVPAALGQKDPENRLLARGPRFRLSAEMIRDQALFLSGLLAERLGGSSVKTYQPRELWKELADTEYVQDQGENLHRRSLYTFWKRTVAPPAMMTFDASGRETCSVRQTRTNTPLQALTLLNEVTFVEAARVFAERILLQGGSTPAERIAWAFRLATGRRPRPAELQVLLDGWQQHREEYRKDHTAARKLVRVGEAPPNEKLDVCELAAWTAVANVILNLDETLTKP